MFFEIPCSNNMLAGKIDFAAISKDMCTEHMHFYLGVISCTYHLCSEILCSRRGEGICSPWHWFQLFHRNPSSETCRNIKMNLSYKWKLKFYNETITELKTTCQIYPNHKYVGLSTVLCHISFQESEYYLRVKPIMIVLCSEITLSLALIF